MQNESVLPNQEEIHSQLVQATETLLQGVFSNLKSEERKKFSYL